MQNIYAIRKSDWTVIEKRNVWLQKVSAEFSKYFPRDWGLIKLILAMSPLIEFGISFKGIAHQLDRPHYCAHSLENY